MMPARALSLLLPALVTACSVGAGGDAIGTCLEENPRPAAVDAGDTGGDGAPPTLADVARDCSEQGGVNCDERSFISLEAATCIARVSGLAAGVRPWSATLGYVARYGRVVWTLTTVREASASSSRGELLVLDAVSGDELERTTYAIGA